MLTTQLKIIFALFIFLCGCTSDKSPKESKPSQQSEMLTIAPLSETDTNKVTQAIDISFEDKNLLDHPIEMPKGLGYYAKGLLFFGRGGSIELYLRSLDEGSYKVFVKASPTLCKGQGPSLKININSQEILFEEIKQEYEKEILVNLKKGLYKLDLINADDCFVSDQEDRNLKVLRLKVYKSAK